jgi:ribonuclease Z
VPLPPDAGPAHPLLAPRAAIRAALRALGVEALRTVHVRHCPWSYGLRLEGGSGGPTPWALVWSGDTRPCGGVVALTRGGRALAPVGALAREEAALAPPPHRPPPPALLLHEATFDDTPEGRALAGEKRHSTAGEAARVGALAGAAAVVLTHFSARHPKLPVVAVAPREPHAPPAAPLLVAYDLMVLWGGEEAALADFVPALRDIFAEEGEEEEEEGAGPPA